MRGQMGADNDGEVKSAGLGMPGPIHAASSLGLGVCQHHRHVGAIRQCQLARHRHG